MLDIHLVIILGCLCVLLMDSYPILYLMQHTSISPDRKLLAVVGDHVDGLLVDSQSGKVCRATTVSYTHLTLPTKRIV